jgi:hypothetical protein
MCSLEEAYQTFSEPQPSRSELDPERKRRKRRKLPEPEVIEPDRPAHRRLPPVEALGGPVTENTQSTSISDMLNATESTEFFPHPSADVNDTNVYNLSPDWAKVFNDSSAPDWIKDRMPRRDTEVPLVPSPWLDGAATLWHNVPESQSTQLNLKGAEKAAESRMDTLQRKLDSMFTKLEEMEVGRAESNHLEIILFVLGGVFLLLLLDLLVKQGTQASLLMAAAGGGSVAGSEFMRRLIQN